MACACASCYSLVTDPLESLIAEARYHRQRYDLYRAKMYGPKPTSDTRLRELKRSLDSADARLAEARAERRRSAAD